VRAERSGIHWEVNGLAYWKGTFEMKSDHTEVQLVLGPSTVLSNRYEIIEEVGRGGMAVVYRARDRSLGEEIAVKILHPLLASDPAGLELLKNEVRVAHVLSHPHIVQLRSFEEDGPIKFLLMEFVDGQSLAHVLKERGKIKVQEVLELAEGICAALAYAHSQKVVHRDIKPANLMLADQGTVKICDFGVARVLRDIMDRVTQHEIGGTPMFMSPEQLSGDKIDARTDIYSLGVALYELLNGAPPFPEGNVAYRALNERPAAVSDVPDHINMALLKALEKDPACRWQSVSELYQALTTPPTLAEEVGRKQQGVAESPPVYREAQRRAAANMASIQQSLEREFRTAQERARSGLATKFSQSADGVLARVAALVEGTLSRARTLAGEGTPEFAGTTAVSELASPDALSAARLPIKSLHLLEQLDSYVRHSVVEVCFYNLKIFAQCLSEKHDRPAFVSKLRKNFAQLPLVQAELEQYFEQPLANDTKVADMFVGLSDSVLREFEGLKTVVGECGDDLGSVECRELFEAEVPKHIDAIMDALGNVRKALEARKVDVTEVVRAAVELQRDRLSKADIEVRVNTKKVPKIFAVYKDLSNVFTELIRNGLKHAFPGGNQGKKQVAFSVAPSNGKGPGVLVVYRDTGQGMSPDDLAKCKIRGYSESGTGEGLPMIARIIEEEHLGELELASEPGKGLAVNMRLPTKFSDRQRRRHDA